MSKTLDTPSLAEAFIQFQIQAKKKEIQDFKDEMSQLEDNKQNLMELKEQLIEEKKRKVIEVNKQIKEQERNLEERQLEDEEQVKHTKQENRQIKKELEKQLKETRCKLAGLQVQVEELETEKQEWLQFENDGSMKNHQKIEKLEKDIDSSKKTFQELLEYFQKISVAVEDIQQKEALKENIKHLAFKEAVDSLGEARKTLIKKHFCLIEQVFKNIKEGKVLESTIQRLEEENLGHVDYIFKILHMNVLLISQDHAFLAQTASLESHDTSGMDRNIMKISLEETSELVNTPSSSLQPFEEVEGAQQERDGTSPSTPPDLSEMFSSQTDFMEPMHLDLLGRRSLCVIGKASPLHTPTNDTVDESDEMTFDRIQAAKWPITTKIIKHKFPQSASQSEESHVPISNIMRIHQVLYDY